MDAGRRARTQVIGRLQAAFPSQAVERIEPLAGGVGDIEVERLRLVDPFLPARGGLDQPGRIDLKSGRVKRQARVKDFVSRGVELSKLGTDPVMTIAGCQIGAEWFR